MNDTLLILDRTSSKKPYKPCQRPQFTRIEVVATARLPMSFGIRQFKDLGTVYRELESRNMKLSTIIAISGALVAMVFAFANLGMYLIAGASPNWAVFLVLMLIAVAVGALPGLMIGWLTGRGNDDDRNSQA